MNMVDDTIIRFLADDLLVIMLFAGAIALVIGTKQQRWVRYSRIIIAGLTALLVAKFMAILYQPEAARPFEVLGMDPGASYLNNPGFPSDHALLAAAIVYAVWFAVRNKWLTISLAVAACLICLGRVLALVHTPLDVAGGVVAASVGAVWYLEGVFRRPRRRLAWFRRLQKHDT